MLASQQSRVIERLGALFAPRWTGSVASWCEQHIRFDEPKLSGPFSFSGREYLREMLDTFSNDSVTDMVLCMGTRTGKTRVAFGGLGWKIKHSPTRTLWVMPNMDGAGGAKNVSRTRFQPMILATPSLSELLPTSKHRHRFKTLQMILNGSIIDLTGSNSASNLSGNPCDTVWQDETDKFHRRGISEAHPSQLADNRTKEFSTPKRGKSSTPTLVSGIIWQELSKSDLRRRFVPCPHCNPRADLPIADSIPSSENSKGWVVFAWSATYTTLQKTGCEAYVTWAPEARHDSGKWDLEMVQQTGHALCPHCKGKILDTHKTWMDAHGHWRATQIGSPRYRGWHLPSMYSVSAETGFGRMAVRFLTAQQSYAGLQDFINSDLAEPYIGQESQSKQTDLIVSRIESTTEWMLQLMVDCQAKSPRFWYVARAWTEGRSEGLAAGSCETYNEVRDIQLRHGIKDIGVMLDSGYGAVSDAEVYRNCARFCSLEAGEPKPMLVGWLPAKGFPSYKRWKHDDGVLRPYYLRLIDPFEGTSDAGKCSISLFEFCGDYFKDILQNLRQGKNGFRWTIQRDMATEEYFRHMDAEIKVHEMVRGRATHHWKPRSKHWPNHLWDCETMQVAGANFYRRLDIGEMDNKVRTK
jgi:hypothetical protein